MKAKQDIGVHLKLTKHYHHILQQAHSLGLSSCQFFLLPTPHAKYPRLTKQEKKRFLTMRRTNFKQIYVHGSYWINPSTGMESSKTASMRIGKKEFSIAEQLEITALVLHAGTAKEFKETKEKSIRQQGIEALASFLNRLLNQKKTVQILIENTAHTGRSVCSDLEDFKILRTLLKNPARVGFCVDTSHAFSYGYNLSKINDFVSLLDNTMGLKNIKLIHLNDSAEQQGSHIDKHALPGFGNIGLNTLIKFIHHPAIQHIPIILEPPSSANMNVIIRAIKGLTP